MRRTLPSAVVRQAIDQQLRPRLLQLPLPPTAEGDQYTSQTISWGKPTEAFSSGSQIELVPCDVSGTATGLPNITAYVQASKASYTMYTGTTLTTSTICAVIAGDDGLLYLLGAPKLVLVNADWSTGVGLGIYIKDDWGLFHGTTSDRVIIFSMTTQDVVTSVDYAELTGALTASRKTLRVFTKADEADQAVLTAVDTRIVTDVNYTSGGTLSHDYRTQKVFPPTNSILNELITVAEDCDQTPSNSLNFM